jgi:hypothetical protein
VTRARPYSTLAAWLLIFFGIPLEIEGAGAP